MEIIYGLMVLLVSLNIMALWYYVDRPREPITLGVAIFGTFFNATLLFTLIQGLMLL